MTDPSDRVAEEPGREWKQRPAELSNGHRELVDIRGLFSSRFSPQNTPLYQHSTILQLINKESQFFEISIFRKSIFRAAVGTAALKIDYF